MAVFPNPVGESRSKIEVFGEQQERHVFKRAVIVQIAGIPAKLVHIDPASENGAEQFPLAWPGTGCVCVNGRTERSEFRAPFGDETVNTWWQLDVEAVFDDEVVFAAALVVDGSVRCPGLRVAVREVEACGRGRLDAEVERAGSNSDGERGDV